MKEQIGSPYTSLPDDIFHHAASGYGGQGTLCGALGSCAAIINLVAKDKDNNHNKLIAHLINWYAEQSFPTTRFDGICYFPKQVRVVPNSPLCHVSVSSWAVAAKTTVTSKEKKDRCAKVTGETVLRTVQLLNDYHEGKALPGVAKAKDATYCLSCHGPAEANNQQGQMQCSMCHDDHNE